MNENIDNRYYVFILLMVVILKNGAIVEVLLLGIHE
jgi:hypothetical protein